MAGHGRSPRHRRKPRSEAPQQKAEAVVVVQGPVRVQKLLASAGLGSRRATEDLIRQGRVSINGKQAQLGDVADPLRDRVALDGEKLASEPLEYWVVNKPTGVVTTVRDPEGRDTIVQLMPQRGRRLYPVGRLDQAT